MSEETTDEKVVNLRTVLGISHGEASTLLGVSDRSCMCFNFGQTVLTSPNTYLLCI